MNFQSKLPNVGTTIFTVMSKLALEHNAINLSQGFPNYDCSPKLSALVNEYIQKGFNQYAPMAGVPILRERLAEKIDRIYSATVNPESEITITAGATQAIFCAIAAFIKPGDEVIIIEPAYDSYGPSIEVNGGTVVPYKLSAPDYKIDWQELAKLISSKTKMICINTPHNPSGTILRKSDLLELEKLVRGSDIIILSDEVYEHLVFDGQRHESVLYHPELYKRSLITYSFGKTFHSTGWKIGYCVGPEILMKEFRKVHQFNVFSVNTPIQYAIADYLKEPKAYQELSSFYQQKRDFFSPFVKASRFNPIPCAGTYFQLVDYAAISDEKDVDFAKRMTTEFGLAVIPVSVFYSTPKHDKVVRICFAKTEEILEKAGEVLAKI